MKVVPVPKIARGSIASAWYVQLSANPASRATTAMLARYSATTRAPRNFNRTVMLPRLVAGPASRNTSAAPGLRPFSTRVAITGVAADAQV